MRKLGNYVCGAWMTGEGDGQVLTDASTGQPLAWQTRLASTWALRYDMPAARAIPPFEG